MSAPTRKTSLALVDRLGATLDGPHRDPVGGSWTGLVDAPAGKVFDTHGTHCVACSGETASEFWASVSAEMDGAGLRDCETVDCDICHPPEDE